MTARRAAIYRRVSSSRQEERGYSLDGQTAECRRLAGELGADVVFDRADVGSGADWDLPGLLDILEAGKRGEFDLLIVYDTSRLARDIGKLKSVERLLAKAGVDVAYVRQQFDDSPVGQLQKDLMAAIDSFERSNLVVRFKLGKRAKIHRGLVVGQGRIPYGFRRVVDPKSGKTVGLAIDPEQAAVVRHMMHLLLTASVDTVANQLTDEGIPAPGGAARWSGATVYAIAMNPAIIGQYVHGRRQETRENGERHITFRPKDEWMPVDVPAIVSQGDLDAVLAAMEYRKMAHGRKRFTPDDDPFILRGLLTCEQCGGQISTNRGRNGKSPDMKRTYTCIRSKRRQAELAGVPKCDLAWIHAEALETYAWELLGTALLDVDRLREGFAQIGAAGEAADATYGERAGHIEREIARRRKALDRATRELLLGDLDEERERSLRAMQGTIEQELRGLKRSLEQLEAARPLGSVADQFADLEAFVREISAGIEHATPAEKRRIFELLRLRATITPDPEGELIGRKRYRIEWTGFIDLGKPDQSQLMRSQDGVKVKLTT